MKFRISDITVGSRKRELGDVTTLAKSIQEIGLLNPVTIQTNGTLIAGYHRLTACTALGWTDIEVNMVDLEALQAELAEIDENLIRSELHYMDRAEHLQRRKEIYEAIHPGTKAGTSQAIGMNRAIGNNVGDTMSPTFTSDTASKVGVSERTIERSIQLAKTFTPEQKKAIKSSAIPQIDATKLARLQPEQRTAVIGAISAGKATDVKEAKTLLRKIEILQRAQTVTIPQTIQLIHGNFSTIDTGIADGSVDLLFTDPPYHEMHLGLWDDLARFAHRVLRPGGLLLAYSGQLFLPQVLSSLSEQLDYCWMLGIAHSGGHIQIWKHHLWNDWKPIVMFSNGKANPDQHEWFMDLYKGDQGDKIAHEWSQGEREAAYYIEKLSRPGALIVDPMCGSGTILRAAHTLGRRSVGIEIEYERYQIALGSMKGIENVPAVASA